jgi:hypothetical protein
MNKNLIWILLLFMCCIGKAEAYIDFGTGSAFIQSIIGSCVGLSFFFKDRVVSILSSFNKGNKSADKNPES